MGETLACVSIRQPWADLVVAGIKPIENRTWYCAHQGPLVIHAGKTWGREEHAAFEEQMSIAEEIGDFRRQRVLARSRQRLGGLVGICNLRMCIHELDWALTGGPKYDGKSQWFVGPYGWVLTGGKMFPQVVPYRGQQGLFRVPQHIVPWPAAWKTPGKYWVSYFLNGQRFNKAMTGLSSRHIAVEVRERYPSARITAIRELRPAEKACV